VDAASGRQDMSISVLTNNEISMLCILFKQRKLSNIFLQRWAKQRFNKNSKAMIVATAIINDDRDNEIYNDLLKWEKSFVQ
jgi:hypothetical protein